MPRGLFVIAGALVGAMFVACSDATFSVDPDGGPSDADASVLDASGSADGSSGLDAMPLVDAAGEVDGSPAGNDGGPVMLDSGVVTTDGGTCGVASDCATPSSCLSSVCADGFCIYGHKPEGTACTSGNCCSSGNCKASSCVY